MKPPSRTQVRDRLGRFARAGRGPARLLVLAARADLTRRLWRLAVVAVALAATVVLLYEHGDTVALERAAQPAAAAVATAGHPSPPARAGAGQAGGPGRAASAPAQGGAARPGRDGSPAAVAAAWYARQEGLEVSLVRSLQQDRVSGRQVRVLVLADRGRGRIDTALVTVRRDAAGRWAVR
ncbi:MAG TPA: hypothetical protein VGA45_08280 [Actinomycetota bacterium]